MYTYGLQIYHDMKIGLYFGSFNPIHVGHLIIAEAALDTAILQEVWFVVSPQNPFKKSETLLHEFDRLKMVELAIQDNASMRASDIEFRLPKPSYTIDTLTHLSEKYPQHEFYLILGADNLQHFHKWKNYEAILKYYDLFVYPRPGSENVIPEKLLPFSDKITFIQAPLLGISATYIRQKVAKGGSIRYLVPSEVAFFIQAKKFYQI